MLQALLLVMLGGALGAAARYLVTHFSSEYFHHHGFPYGTLAVNVIGSFLVGYVLTWSADHSHDRWRLLAATGFCGGFTTLSAFAYETMAYWDGGQMLLGGPNVGFKKFLSFFGLPWGAAVHQSQ